MAIRYSSITKKRFWLCPRVSVKFCLFGVLFCYFEPSKFYWVYLELTVCTTTYNLSNHWKPRTLILKPFSQPFSCPCLMSQGFNFYVSSGNLLPPRPRRAPTSSSFTPPLPPPTARSSPTWCSWWPGVAGWPGTPSWTCTPSSTQPPSATQPPPLRPLGAWLCQEGPGCSSSLPSPSLCLWTRPHKRRLRLRQLQVRNI